MHDPLPERLNMTIDIPAFVAVCIGTFIMGFGVAKGIYRDSKPFRNRDQELAIRVAANAIAQRGKSPVHRPDEPCNCANGIGCVYQPVSQC